MWKKLITLREEAGWSMTEVLVVIAIVGIFCAIAGVSVQGAVDAAREMAAVKEVRSRLRAVRGEAVVRSTGVAGRFVRRADGVVFQMIVDGDGDGVRTSDIASGADRVLSEVPLEATFTGVRFGLAFDVPGIEPGDEALVAGGDPLRIGAGEMVSFGAEGGGSSGTVYLCSARNRQFAVRVHGVTGRVRAFVYQPALGQWTEA